MRSKSDAGFRPSTVCIHTHTRVAHKMFKVQGSGLRMLGGFLRLRAQDICCVLGFRV